MAKVTRWYAIKIYRFLILFLGFLFIQISGCRSRQPEQNDQMLSGDTATTDNELFPAPEYGAKPVNWEEIPEEVKMKKNDVVKDETSEPENKNKDVQTPVMQPAPEPLEPATAYGTNIQNYSPSIQPGE